ncbi:MAG: hypothetical protein A2015_17345 [Spirochaetes bacterium GWF1_31_7]|nr:MAG: hypothetical protein A2Y30_14575 [Spirochaetes bacterium GWE1_32_154]OHD46863.1 MAG: hypothetical protein A2015_17345 [Spirochaetes bacterium GWF1_31_7]OHD50180.1 MAG: hypothetical protein A2Y29_12620 [Spirochaetes bacterium GWE2_31_10]OHD81975.1 MAG: hypothetical protein A2355_02050 [Spirochaetes bacterium RIFOXYB1_FULL_32_8]HBD94041.1 hypothetical protein [Spirochaetia bacterium]
MSLRKIVFCISFSLSVFNFFSQDISSTIQFKWGVLTLDKKTNKTVGLNFSKPVQLSEGDDIRIYLEPVKNAFIYLYLLDSNNDLMLLFPENFTQFSKNYSNKPYYIPDAESWFTIDENSGTEEFYLIASKVRQPELESLTGKLQKESEKSTPNSNKINELKKSIIDELARLRKENSTNVAVAEKPVSTAGTTRSIGEVTTNATEVLTENFYAKTLRLEH